MAMADTPNNSRTRFEITGSGKDVFHIRMLVSDISTDFSSNLSFSWSKVFICLCIALPAILALKRTLAPTRVEWHHARSTVRFKARKGTEVELSRICRAVAPPCFLNPFLKNAHLQTLSPLFDKSDFPLFFRRKIFQSQNVDFPGSFAVDFQVPPFTEQSTDLPTRTAYYNEELEHEIGSDDDKPMLVVLHGLCGGSHEKYIQHVLSPLVHGPQKWEACVVLSRGCGQSHITGGGMYYAHATSDLRLVVEWLRETFPNRPLYAAGFSMGANIMTRYIAEQGEECAFKAAVALSNPWNLETTMLHLQRTFLGRRLYSPGMTASLMEIFSRNTDKIQTSDGKPLKLSADCNVHLMHEYDQLIQCPTWGFPTERVYYRQASSSDAVLDVRIPLWAINSDDDPIVGYESLPKAEFKATPFTVMTTTAGGGHLGWHQWDGQRWYAHAVVTFFEKMHAMGDPEMIVPKG